ncbi:hypothetical protein Y032_0030g2106 [Ancylostoma ceylanicum]|uniref:Uncharacterized protein n=1 Tax=Ancylostoma ceylanicum TaxID=53326 RepID=A0A016URT7_9BILA|nr:hypothetical protein Y032_0030g2106 [Ancylostoma ceylanicum]
MCASDARMTHPSSMNCAQCHLSCIHTVGARFGRIAKDAYRSSPESDRGGSIRILCYPNGSDSDTLQMQL